MARVTATRLFWSLKLQTVRLFRIRMYGRRSGSRQASLWKSKTKGLLSLYTSIAYFYIYKSPAYNCNMKQISLEVGLLDQKTNQRGHSHSRKKSSRKDVRLFKQAVLFDCLLRSIYRLSFWHFAYGLCVGEDGNCVCASISFHESIGNVKIFCGELALGIIVESIHAGLYTWTITEILHSYLIFEV